MPAAGGPARSTVSPTPFASGAATPLASAPTTASKPDPFADFRVWFERWHRHEGRPPPDLETQGLALVRQRSEAMRRLIRTDPRQALERALPTAVRASLPPSMRDLLETRVSGRGDLEVLCVLPEPGREGEIEPLQRYAVLSGTRYRAYVYGRRVVQPTRREIFLNGIALDRLMAVAESSTRTLETPEAAAFLSANPAMPCAHGADHPAAGPNAVVLEACGEPVPFCQPTHASAYAEELAAAEEIAQPPAAASAAAGVRKRLIFIRVDFPDLTGEPFGTNRAAALARELDQFYQSNSYGRAGFSPIGEGSEVTPVFRLSRTAASYGAGNDAGDLRADARNAARAAGYVLGNFDYDIICLRNVPGFGWAGLGYVGAPGAWIRGTSSTGVTAHELGHNFGLPHANFWDTGGETITGPGQSIEYGDKFDTMGAANAGNYHFNARYKRLLGWLQEGEYTVATTNGRYRIFAHDQPVSGSRGLQVFANARTNYWLEYRQLFTNKPALMQGASLRWAGRGSEASLLLDTTPGSALEKDDAPILIGRTYSDFAAGIHLTPVARGGANPAWLDIVVNRGLFPSNRPPSLALRGGPAVGSTATEFHWQAEAHDPDGDELAYAWDFGDQSPGPNAASVTHRWTNAGHYRLQCTVSDLRGGTARQSVLVQIGNPATFRLAGRVVADGQPAANAKVSIGQGRQTYTDSDGTFELTGVPRGTYTLAAGTLEGVRFEPQGFRNPVSVTGHRTGLDFAAADAASGVPLTLLAAGSSWRYWDQGTDPGPDWREAAFEDSAWNEGPAILGYGGDRETTIIGFGPNASQKFITSWFRRSVVVPDPRQLTRARIGLLRDDGAIVHLNGRELVRDNLPTGSITASTRASSTVSGAAEQTYYEWELDPASFLEGTNQLAVEVHQSGPTSSDTAFDLRLTAEAAPPNEPGIRWVRPTDAQIFTAPARVVLSAIRGDPPGSRLQRLEFLADGQVVATASQPPFSATWLEATPGKHVLGLRGHLADGTILEGSSLAIEVRDPELTPTLIARGSDWRFLDTGIAPDAGWTSLAFDDATWGEGPARLGYGEDGEFTRLRYGTNPSLRHVTTWFRRRFEVAAADQITQLVCRMARDDGAIVHLNGQEVLRSNLRAGPVTATTLAASEVTNDAEQVYLESSLDADALVEGMNVLAAEVHQVNRSSSDLGFDLELIARRSGLPAFPQLAGVLGPAGLTLRWPARFAAWTLETTPDLASPAAWSRVEGTPSTLGDQVVLTLQAPPNQAFFRLAAPSAR